MSPPDPDQSASRPTFSWESVVGSDDADAVTSGGDAPGDAPTLDPISLSIAPLSLEPLPPLPAAPARDQPPAPSILGEIPTAAPTAEPASQPTIPAPPQITPPSLGPVANQIPAAPTAAPALPTLDPTGATEVASPPAGPPSTPTDVGSAADVPSLEGFAPVLPGAVGDGYVPRPPAVTDSVPTTVAGDVVTDDGDASAEVAPPSEDIAPPSEDLEPADLAPADLEPHEPADDDDGLGADIDTSTDSTTDEPAQAELRIAPLDIPDAVEQPTGDVVGIADESPADAVTTTVFEAVDGDIASPMLPGADGGTATDAAAPSLPGHQPNQAAPRQPQPAEGPDEANGKKAKRAKRRTSAATSEEATPKKKGRGRKQRAKRGVDVAETTTAPATPKSKAERKKAAKAAKAKAKAAKAKPAKSKRANGVKKSKQKSRAGGVALIFTLLVLIALVVAAVVFGRPYLFPDDWDPESRPYADAVQTVLGEDVAEPVVVVRVPSATYEINRTDHLLGEWEQELPLWRSYGLVSGAVDAPLLRETVANWSAAFYAPTLGEVMANDALTPEAVDGAIVEAMTMAALDQQNGWSVAIDDALLDHSALVRAQVGAVAGETAAASTYGPAISERRRDKAEFLPPALSYRVNAPVVMAELVPDGAERLDELAAAFDLAPSRAPELAPGDTATSTQQSVDRGFWYLVFAAYTDAPTAYAASNSLVEASLAAADRSGTFCSYATLAGTDVVGTERVSNTLQQWVANAPVEMAASFDVLADGTMQLTTCDPGVDVTSGARFGTASELTRWRLVELAAFDGVDATGTPADRAAAIDRVRTNGAALDLMNLPFDTSVAELAQQARNAALSPG
ncbi:MAG: hypothetical protein HKN44_03000 [Ilumatobacter sp.]|nr:hypothetical protein [Ilumatobacter sp.]